MTMLTTETEHLDAQMSKIKPTWGYYRQPNSWITLSPATELEELQYRKQGWEPLTRYGKVDMGSAYVVSHPLEPLLIRGGAHELCVEQLLQTGMAHHPPLVPSCKTPLHQFHKGHAPSCWERAQPVYFPQLEGVEVPGPFPCRFCGVEKPTMVARDQHEGVAHKDEKSDIRTGETLAEAIVRGLKTEQPSATPVVLDSDDVLAMLAKVGLNKKQQEALTALGITLPEKHTNDEA